MRHATRKRNNLTRIDPRDPLVIDTRTLGRRPGSMRRDSRRPGTGGSRRRDGRCPRGRRRRAGSPARGGRWRVCSSRARRVSRSGRVRALPGPVTSSIEVDVPGALLLLRHSAPARARRTRAVLRATARPRACGPRRGGARTAAVPGVPGRLPRAVPRVRGPAGRCRAGPPSRRASTLGGPRCRACWIPNDNNDQEELTWPSQSGKSRAAIPGTAARSGRPRRRRCDAAPSAATPKLPHTACPTCGTYNRRQVIDVA